MPETMASPPDPTVIAKLANELFVAMSGIPVHPVGALPMTTALVPRAEAPAVSVPGAPQDARLEHPAETDPRTVLATPIGAAAFVPANPEAVPAQARPARLPPHCMGHARRS